MADWELKPKFVWFQTIALFSLWGCILSRWWRVMFRLNANYISYTFPVFLLCCKGVLVNTAIVALLCAVGRWHFVLHIHVILSCSKHGKLFPIEEASQRVFSQTLAKKAKKKNLYVNDIIIDKILHVNNKKSRMYCC